MNTKYMDPLSTNKYMYPDAYKIKRLQTKPINPDTSSKENPITAHLIKTLEIIGFRHIEKIKILGINPTPTATPANEINGILLAEYLKPRRTIN